jgi:hypothetical protein
MLAWSHTRPWPPQLLVLADCALALEAAGGAVPSAAAPNLRMPCGGDDACGEREGL